jgi:molybdopterin converting factor small subunit
MSIRVEFYGVVRHRAGVPGVSVEGTTLGEVVKAVREACPALESVCLSDGTLAKGTLANLEGRRFVTDPLAEVAGEGVVLILSADVGG